MKIFIFKDVEELTDRYHESGGLVIIARDLERALDLAKNHSECYWEEGRKCIKLSNKEIENVISLNLVEEAEEGLFLFPNSGCC